MDISTIQHTIQYQQIISFIYIFVGAISTLLALFFWGIIKYNFFRGMAYPLLCFGLIELLHFTKNYNTLALSFSNTSFMIGYILSVCLSLACYFFFKNKFWKGFSLGLTIKLLITALLNFLIF